MSSPRTIQVFVARRQNDCFPPYPGCPNYTSSTSEATDSPPSSAGSGSTAFVAASTTTLESSTPASDPSTSAEPSSSTLPSSDPPSSTSTILAPSSTSSQSPAVDATSTASNAGTIAGCVVGGVVFLVLVALALLLYLRARKRKRTPPSSEFMNSFKAGTTPVLRLDSGAEYTPTIPEKGGGYTHYPPPSVPPPFMQNSYYSGSPTRDMKFPDDTIPSGKPSIDQPLHPRRFSTQATNESFPAHHHGSSVGSHRELWGSDTEIHVNASDLSPVRLDSVLQFTPRFSLDELSSQPSHSPPSLHPLRRQPD